YGDYLKSETWTLGNNLSTNCAIEKRFSGILSSDLVYLVIPYYNLLLNNPNRTILRGIIFSPDIIPQVGKRYNVRVGSDVYNSMLLRSIEITPQGIRGEFVFPA
ncbi:MAG: hypothetical protein ACPL1F_00960, partial [bacterium]